MKTFLSVLLGVMVLAGCSAGSTADEASLTDREVDALVRALSMQPLQTLFGRTGAKAAQDGEFEIGLSASSTCPEGGMAALAGTLSGTIEAGSGLLTIDLEQTLTDCGLVLDDQPYVVNTDPALTFGGTAEWSRAAFEAEQAFGLTGTLTLAPDGTDALIVCPVDLQYTASLSNQTAAVSGQVCATTVDLSFTWSEAAPAS